MKHGTPVSLFFGHICGSWKRSCYLANDICFIVFVLYLPNLWRHPKIPPCSAVSQATLRPRCQVQRGNIWSLSSWWFPRIFFGDPPTKNPEHKKLKVTSIHKKSSMNYLRFKGLVIKWIRFFFLPPTFCFLRIKNREAPPGTIWAVCKKPAC